MQSRTGVEISSFFIVSEAPLKCVYDFSRMLSADSTYGRFYLRTYTLETEAILQARSYVASSVSLVLPALHIDSTCSQKSLLSAHIYFIYKQNQIMVFQEFEWKQLCQPITTI